MVDADWGVVLCGLNQPNEIGFPTRHFGQKKVLLGVCSFDSCSPQAHRRSRWWGFFLGITGFLPANRRSDGVLIFKGYLDEIAASHLLASDSRRSNETNAMRFNPLRATSSSNDLFSVVDVGDDD